MGNKRHAHTPVNIPPFFPSPPSPPPRPTRSLPVLRCSNEAALLQPSRAVVAQLGGRPARSDAQTEPPSRSHRAQSSPSSATARASYVATSSSDSIPRQRPLVPLWINASAPPRKA